MPQPRPHTEAPIRDPSTWAQPDPLGGSAPAGLGIVFRRALRGTGGGKAASLSDASLMPLPGGQMVSEPPRAAQPACLLCGGRARGAGGALVVISRRRARAIRRPLGSCSALGAKLLSSSSLLLLNGAAPVELRGNCTKGTMLGAHACPGAEPHSQPGLSVSLTGFKHTKSCPKSPPGACQALPDLS